MGHDWAPVFGIGIIALSTAAAVVLRGRLFQRKELDALLASVGKMPDLRVNDWVR